MSAVMKGWPEFFRIIVYFNVSKNLLHTNCQLNEIIHLKNGQLFSAETNLAGPGRKKIYKVA